MKNNYQSGQVLVLAIVVVGLVLVNSLAIIGGASIFRQNTNYSVESTQALDLAEAGVDKALASLNKTGGSYNGETETFIGNGSYSVTVTNKSGGVKGIQVTGYVPNKTNPKVKRMIAIDISKGSGISFVYGMLAGNGGISMGNGSTINGSVYSNGSILTGNNETITGDVYVAGGVQTTYDQQSDCIDGCQDYIFGKNVAGDDRLDVAQSFKPRNTATLEKVSLKLKKAGLPANPTIRIMTDDHGSPNRNGVLASAVLSADKVTGSYGFVDVTFDTNPTLTSDTTYWIMIASQALDNSNYWIWSQDSLSGYSRGAPAWSSDWQNSWHAISTGDLGFRTWMGGIATSVEMANGSVIKGNVHANTIKGMTINKDAYYMIINDAIVNGTKYPNSSNPASIALPISDANISDWKSGPGGAESYGTTTGDINGCPSNILGPGKIVGNITINNTCTVIVKTPLWITGNLITGNQDVFKMDSSLGSSSGMMIVDGITTFSNGDDLLGTGSPGSYLMLLSTYNSSLNNGTAAINTNNSSITGILYAPFGIISLANRATFKEVVAWQINMGTGTTLTYDSGLISTFFSTGPSGSYSLVKGTYQVK